MRGPLNPASMQEFYYLPLLISTLSDPTTLILGKTQDTDFSCKWTRKTQQ
jgi:hypothetical protein